MALLILPPPAQGPPFSEGAHGAHAEEEGCSLSRSHPVIRDAVPKRCPVVPLMSPHATPMHSCLLYPMHPMHSTPCMFARFLPCSPLKRRTTGQQKRGGRGGQGRALWPSWLRPTPSSLQPCRLALGWGGPPRATFLCRKDYCVPKCFAKISIGCDF